jgi:uncharacterized protein with HEPN domain
MSHSNLDLLRHINDEVIFILESTANKEKDELISDKVLSRAIIRSLEIIGEAAKKLDEEFKATNNRIEWKKIAGTRDRLIHEYFGVDYDIVWDIISTKLPELQEYVQDILETKG